MLARSRDAQDRRRTHPDHGLVPRLIEQYGLEDRVTIIDRMLTVPELVDSIRRAESRWCRPSSKALASLRVRRWLVDSLSSQTLQARCRK